MIQPKQKPFQLQHAPIPKEDSEQAALAMYLDMLWRTRKIRWAHCPNGGDRDIRVATRLKAHGVKRGVPDCLIFNSPPQFPEAKGVAIELKRRAGGVVSDEQEMWLKHLADQGWIVCVAKGWEEAVKFLKSIGF